MYYLTVKNLGTEKCIDRNEEDIYRNGQYYSFIPDLGRKGNRIVREIEIRCVEVPGPRFSAVVYSD